MPTASQLKRAAHKEKFRKIGQALTAMKPHTDDRDYYTGREPEFKIKAIAVNDPKVSSRFFGPQMKAQQWERTTRG